MSRAAQQRATFRRLTEALHSEAPAGDIQQLIVEEARRLTNAATAALCLLTPGRDLLDFVAVAGENADEIVGLKIRVADSLSENVLATGEPALIDTRTAQETGSLFAEMEEESQPRPRFRDSTTLTRSAAVVPLFRSGKLVGTLSALNKDGDPSEGTPFAAFDADDLDLLTLLSEQAALAVKCETTSRIAREQSRELAVLYDTAQTVSGSLNVQEVMESVLNAICAHVEHHTAALFLMNDERTHLYLAADRGLTDAEREVQLSVESGIPGKVLFSGISRRITDTDEEADFNDLSDRARALSALYAPIRSRDETLGLIVVTSLQRHAYTEDDLKLLSAVAQQAGIAIENAWLYEDAQRRADESVALYDLSQHINSTLNLDRVLNFVGDSVLNLLNADGFALLLSDPKEGRLVPKLVHETSVSEIDREAFTVNFCPKVGQGIAGWVFEWQTPQAVAEVAADARNRSCPMDIYGIASTLCVPMHVNDEVIGVMLALSDKRRLFTVAEMELLYTIANQAAVAVVNATLYQDARNRTRELRRYFSRVAQALGTALDEGNLPQLLANLCAEAMQAERCAIYRLEGETLKLHASSRFRNSVPPDAEIPLGSGLAGWTAKRGQSLVLPDLNADSRSRFHSWLQRDRLASYLAVPIKEERRTVGVIELYTTEPREFTREEALILSTFARRSRVAKHLTGKEQDRPIPTPDTRHPDS